MDPDAPAKINVSVKLATGQKYDLQVAPNISVEDFKVLLAEKSQIPSEQQRLIYSGHVLKNEQTIDQFGTHTSFSVLPPSTAILLVQSYSFGLISS